MKSLCTILIAAAVVAACSKSEPPQSADTPQPLAEAHAAVPAEQPPAATAVAPTTGQQTPARQSAERSATGSVAVPESSASSVAATAPAQVHAPTRAAATPAPLAAEPVPVAAAAPVQAKPTPPPQPKFRDVTIPAGTPLTVTVLSTLASKTSQVEDMVKGALAKPVIIDGMTVLPANTQITGLVTDVKQSGRVKGKASIAFRFMRVSAWNEDHKIQTARVILDADDSKKDDVKKGGLGAGLGAVVGGIAGGGTGAAIGAVTGGTAAVVGTKGKEVEVPAGTVVQVLVQDPFTVRMPVK
jgi:hypothetical protein